MLCALEPIRRALQEHGLPYRDPFVPQEDLENLFYAEGLGRRRAGETSVVFPSAEVAIGVARQSRWAPLLLRQVPVSMQMPNLKQDCVKPSKTSV